MQSLQPISLYEIPWGFLCSPTLKSCFERVQGYSFALC